MSCLLPETPLPAVTDQLERDQKELDYPSHLLNVGNSLTSSGRKPQVLSLTFLLGDPEEDQCRIQTLRQVGARSSRPLDKEGTRSPKKIFSALRPSVWSKNKRGPGSPRAPRLDPPLRIFTLVACEQAFSLSLPFFPQTESLFTGYTLGTQQLSKLLSRHSCVVGVRKLEKSRGSLTTP